jgi:hypothetical protein
LLKSAIGCTTSLSTRSEPSENIAALNIEPSHHHRRTPDTPRRQHLGGRTVEDVWIPDFVASTWKTIRKPTQVTISALAASWLIFPSLQLTTSSRSRRQAWD